MGVAALHTHTSTHSCAHPHHTPNTPARPTIIIGGTTTQHIHSDTIRLVASLVVRYVHCGCGAFSCLQHTHKIMHTNKRNEYTKKKKIEKLAHTQYTFGSTVRYFSWHQCHPFCRAVCAQSESLGLARTYTRRSCLTGIRVHVWCVCVCLCVLNVFMCLLFRPEATAIAVPGKAPENNHGASKRHIIHNARVDGV